MIGYNKDKDDMSDYSKTIVLENGEVEQIDFNTKGYCGYSLGIIKSYKEHDNIKTIRLNMWDDFSFRGYSTSAYNDNIQIIDFKFTASDPLYFPLNRLLMYKNPFIIDDDATKEKMKKYMEIKKEDNQIVITFYNSINKDECDGLDKWYILVKNVFADPRSKMVDINDKCKLTDFFEDVQEFFSSSYHQMNIDEYLELKKHSEKVLRK